MKQKAAHGLRVSPPDTLHVTCYSLVSPRDNYDKSAYWNQISTLVEACMDRLSQEIAAFPLHFRSLRVTNKAIVAIADEQPVVSIARSIFSNSIASPPGPSQKMNMIHTTLCRYQDATRLPRDLPQMVSNVRIDATAQIEAAVLVRELVYPSLRNDVITWVNLARPASLGERHDPR
jgi:hypothetical protein